MKIIIEIENNQDFIWIDKLMKQITKNTTLQADEGKLKENKKIFLSYLNEKAIEVETIFSLDRAEKND